ncbi:hypothetical protein IFM89_032375 [Coptis chinensis]|uniref:Pentatricopeptide repeat-containing protein n=1 Tax=Coptis chinensis TaxID=261450 RepID=A0A835I147_9MAGN|nr:hypothetical protein IFM89_032375 [Coptis chinensis]
MGQQLHTQVIKLGLVMDPYISSSLMYLYTCCGELGFGKLVFEGINVKNVVTWNVMISGCVRSGVFVKEGLEYFKQMRILCVDSFDEFSLVSVSSACANMGALVLGKWVHGLVCKTGFCDVVPLGNALVDMYGKCGNLADACKVFDQMRGRDIVSWSTMIDVLAMHGCGRRAIDVFDEMERFGIEPDEMAFTSVLCACSHAGLLHQGEMWFERMSCDYGLKPKIQHYGCMVDLLGKAGKLKEAYELIQKMPIGPDAAIWRSMVGACLHHGNFDLASLAASELVLFDPDDSGDVVILSNVYSKLRRWDDVERLRKGTRKSPGHSFIEVDNDVHEFFMRDNFHPQIEEICLLVNKIAEWLIQDITKGKLHSVPRAYVTALLTPFSLQPLTEASGAPLPEIHSFKQVLMEKATPFCPWGFLNLEVPQTQSLTVTVPEKEVVTDVRPSKSYAAVLKPKYGRNIDTSLLPIPGRQEKSPVVQNVDKEALTSNVVVDVDLSIMSKNQRKRWRRKNTNGASSSGSKENGVALGISTENAENFKVVPSENQADKQGESEENAIQIETEGGTSMVVAEAILTEQVMDGQNKFLPSKELVVETSVEILPCIDVVEAIGHGSEQGACEISPEGILEIVPQGPPRPLKSGKLAKYKGMDGDTCQYYKASSIWPGVREALLEVKSRSQWVIGNGAKADLIRDNWLSSTSLQTSLELTLPQLKGFNAKVNSILVNNNWSIPPILQNMLDAAGLINSSLADCGKHDPELNEELKKDITDLLTEELSLQRIVTNDNMQHTKASIVEARKTSSHYQKEAEKCTAGMETCEEAREKAEAELRAERKLSAVWEERAREHGWKDLRKAYL